MPAAPRPRRPARRGSSRASSRALGRSALRVVITAGPTREHLDDVRFLSNGSTGAMGIELAREARRRGAGVTLLLGPTPLEAPAGVRVVRVTSTADLLRAARAAVRGAHLVLFAAAPADWRPARRRAGKPPKRAYALRLRLVPTPDVAATLGRRKAGRLHVGFALESGPGGRGRALEKLRRKALDAVVWNTPSNLGAGGGPACWLTPAGVAVPLPTRSKRSLARAILAQALHLLAAPGPARASRAGPRAPTRGS